MLLELLFSLPVIADTPHWRSLLADSMAASQRAQAGQFTTLPVDGVITGHFGPRHHPILDLTRPHRGIDIAASEGEPFRAVASGKIVTADYHGDFGNLIVIEHNDTTTRYAHAQEIFVEVGQLVRAGDIIGAVGQTGLATGPHLHFEVMFQGEHTDPIAFMQKTDRDTQGWQEADPIATMLASSSTDHDWQDYIFIDDNFNERLMENIYIQIESRIQQQLLAYSYDVNHSFNSASSFSHQPTSLVTSSSLWGLALDITEGTGADVYQGMLAIYEHNRDAFIGGNINLRRGDLPIKLPSDKAILGACPLQAKAKFYQDLNRLG